MVDGKKKYQCNRCSILLSSFDSVKNHIVTIHLKYYSEKCSLCDEKFGRSACLKAHMAAKHSMTEHKVDGVTILESVKKICCPHCKKEFNCPRLLRCHVRHMHMTTKCPDCSVDLRLKELPVHRHKVHGASIPTCGICGYINRSQSRVDWHQRKVHIKEKNIECTHCGEMFFDKEGLKKHEVRHDPVKKFECSYCNKKFPRKRAQKTHEMIHTGEKNKVCRICDERFVQKASLNYHMTKHHPDAL